MLFGINVESNISDCMLWGAFASPEWDRVQDVVAGGGEVVKIMVLNIMDDSLHFIESLATASISQIIESRQLLNEGRTWRYVIVSKVHEQADKATTNGANPSISA